MRKRVTKILSLIMVCSMTMALAACGKSESKDKKESEEKGGTKEVTMWHYFNGTEYELLTKAIEEYNEKQDDIHITETFVSRNELMNQYNIGAVSGELPDIGMVDSPDMSSFISLGVFDDIDKELNEWGELDNFYDGPLNSCRDSEGKLHGLPNSSSCLALACNMDVLRAHGFETPPTTWDELYEVAKACTDKDADMYGFTMSTIATEEGTYQFMPWLYSAGGDISNMESPEAVKAMDFLAKMVNEGIMSKETTNWTQGDAFRSFAAGKAAMSMAGTWHISQIDTKDIEVNFDYQFALLPKDKEYSSCIGGENLGVCSGSDAKEECVEFLEYLLTKENNADWCEAISSQPVRKDSADSKDVWTTDERFKVFTEAMDYAVARGPHPSWPTISEAVYTNEQAALLGEKTAEQACKDAAATIKPILEEEPLTSQ